jgi:indolepyruvate ferredoxin oxidoreductase alpha subunit
MSDKILSNEVGKKVILLGNEAIVRGALESGIGFASTYPGTPASEIGDTFAEIAKQAGIYFEYSTNEKVALEAAGGAALCGIKSLVSFKHFGLNVASDSLMPLAYVGTSGFVVVVADDPNCWSSAQSEQDSRWYARLAHIPMLEPSDPQECKDFTKLAFQISEKFKLPVMIRTTTRVSHARGAVKLGKIVKGKTKGKFIKDLKRFFNLSPGILKLHEDLLKKMDDIQKLNEKLKVNFVVNDKVKSDFGIVTSGVSFNYVIEALDDLKIKLPVLKLSLTYPLPEKKIKNFIKKFKTLLVVEELDDIVEKEIKALAKDVNPKLKIFGKNLLPKVGEFTEEIVASAISKITGKKLSIKLKENLEKYEKIKIARRFALMCPGCPHRATFYAAKKAAKDAIFAGDIGCYILGIYPPLETQDFLFSMGASEGVVHGIKKVSDQKAIAFIGDSTFFHAGIPGLINIVYNKSNPLVIVLDNRITAMTGHQPHPGVGITGMGEQTKEIAIDEIAKACKVENVKVVDPFNLKEMIETIKEFLDKKETSLIVARRECQLLAVRRKKREGIKIPVFEIDQSKCTKCGICLYEFACPAIMKNKNFYIDETICTGCAVCVQVCPSNAIKVKK